MCHLRKKVQKPSLQQTHWECRVVELLNSFLRTCLLTLAAVSNGDLLGGLAALGAIRLDLNTETIYNSNFKQNCTSVRYSCEPFSFS